MARTPLGDEKRVPTSVSLDKACKEWLERKAKEKRVAVSSLLNEMLFKEIENESNGK